MQQVECLIDIGDEYRFGDFHLQKRWLEAALRERLQDRILKIGTLELDR